jgi:hypothetical protein
MMNKAVNGGSESVPNVGTCAFPGVVDVRGPVDLRGDDIQIADGRSGRSRRSISGAGPSTRS